VIAILVVFGLLIVYLGVRLVRGWCPDKA